MRRSSGAIKRGDSRQRRRRTVVESTSAAAARVEHEVRQGDSRDESKWVKQLLPNALFKKQKSSGELFWEGSEHAKAAQLLVTYRYPARFPDEPVGLLW